MRTVLVFIAAVILSSTVNAQLHVNFNFNADRQPVWGPAGYDYVEYYYLPDIEVYYSVPQHKYFYYERGRWIGRSSLPSRYRGYNLYNSYKVVVNEPTPFRNHRTYRDKYSSYKGRHDQQPIRDARDPKYYGNPNHPEHNNWVRQHKHDNGNGKGNGNAKENGRGNKPGRK
ncbi:MAG: hypothetical protein EHM64_06440 [Ignavibacteriae bacterium]|nr:MAG: hypothetical protein EHM64_06440 [Ignavibacteriota bacterium]